MEIKQLSHDRLQQECFLWLWNTYPQTRYLCFHPANEMKMLGLEVLCDIIVSALRCFKMYVERPTIMAFLSKFDFRPIRARLGSQGKAIGIVSGVYDLIFYWDTLYAFDFKVGKDRLSDNQKAFASAVFVKGGFCFEINSLEQFKEIIKTIVK